MSDEIQELKNTLFSHYLLKDHDATANTNISKGCLLPNNRIGLNGQNILGQRHPLYLKSLIECLELPTEISQHEALIELKATTNFIFQKLELAPSHFPFIQILNSSDKSHEFWRNPDYRVDSDVSQFVIPLNMNHSLIFSRSQILNYPEYLPMIMIIYQGKITDLFYKQNFLSPGGRVELLSTLINNEASKLGLTSRGLMVTLSCDTDNSPLVGLKKEKNRTDLLFPVYISNDQVHNIFKLIKDLL